MLATVALEDDNNGSEDAANKWAAKLDQRYGADYSDGLDSKKDNLNDVAADAFSSVRPYSIRVGLKLFSVSDPE